MNEELTRAAADASEALGMDLHVDLHRCGHVLELYGPMHGADGEQPLVTWYNTKQGLNSAIAYLNGLETGARIQRERYAEVVSAVHAMFSDMDAGYSPARGDCAVDRLAKALSELEG